MKLHPLATRNIMKLAHLSFKKVSGIPDFNLFANFNGELEPPKFDARDDVFADPPAAGEYLNANTSRHVFLAFGPLYEPGENLLMSALILVPGDKPISFDGSSYSYDDKFLCEADVQQITVHPVRDGKFWELTKWILRNAGSELEDVPKELYFHLPYGQPAFPLIAINVKSEISGIKSFDGTLAWAIDAHDPKRYE